MIVILRSGLFLCFQAIAMRDSMAKSLYGALFDWIVLHINHATMNKRDVEESVPVSRMIQIRLETLKWACAVNRM